MNLFFARKQCVWGRARCVPGRLGYSPVGCPLAGYGCLRLNILTAAWSPGFRTGAANTRPGRALRAPAPSHPIHRVVVLTLWHRSPPDAHVKGLGQQSGSSPNSFIRQSAARRRRHQAPGTQEFQDAGDPQPPSWRPSSGFVADMITSKCVKRL